MIAAISMGLAVLIWSLYPIAAAEGLKTMTSLEVILLMQVFASIGALIITLIHLWQTKSFKKVIAIQKSLPRNAYIYITISGIAGVLCHGFFIVSLTLANKGGVSLIYESWPIIALVATPLLIKRAWKQVSFHEFLVSLCALGGVALIILGDQNLGFGDKVASTFSKAPKQISDFDFVALGGYVLAFAGAYMCAVLVVTKATYSNYFTSMKDDFGASLVSESVCRTISMIFVIPAFVFLSDDLNFENIHWQASFFIGFVVFVLGGALYTYSMLSTNRPTIHIVYYFVPVLAVVWLYIAGETTINNYLIAGGIIVVIANIYLALKARKAPLSTGV